MTQTPSEPGKGWSPLEDDQVEDAAMDEVLASYADVIEDRRKAAAEPDHQDE